MTARIVVLGGGTGGTVLANKLASKLDDELDRGDAEVTLIDETGVHVYKPVWLYVAFGDADPAEGRRPLDDLLHREVRLRTGRVTDIDTDAKRLTVDGTSGLDYDHLVVATGARLVPDRIPGLVEGAHDFYSEAGAERLREALAAFDGGRLVLSVAGMPHMCPAAPVEFTLMVEDWLHERGLRDASEVVYTAPTERSHKLPPVADWADERFDARGVESYTGFAVERVDPEERTLHAADGRALDYDLLVTIPPHAGVDLVTEAGLGDDGWVETDPRTLEAARADDVYAIGDTTDIERPMAGSVAHYQAGVVADRIAARVRGHHPTATYDGKVLCFLEAGMDEATFVSFDYDSLPDLREESTLVHWAKGAYNESYWLTARGLI
ncbi:NAD(P)/FAD-dependent oxidoreductase [Haloplanus rubicundus]|uniref:NAD(P)/FAD-dependent oxidoreductase n=1 Tax=Haloplanus rubicundus TaxID=1547898 RepID=A0A345E985_9EURY|nr:FAD-dependent oxidoreductase [Haloplanus rubicundus]AXG08757.1 NAD(P)/FAD-dependent oxidoreductase [Haloplanus rubicundus]